MRAVIQRVSSASVAVDGQIVGSCQRGYLILLGVADGDTELDAELLCKKIAALRIFRDENDKMNLSIRDINGEALVENDLNNLIIDFASRCRNSY